jgi:hypothetical protein
MKQAKSLRQTLASPKSESNIQLNLQISVLFWLCISPHIAYDNLLVCDLRRLRYPGTFLPHLATHGRHNSQESLSCKFIARSQAAHAKLPKCSCQHFNTVFPDQMESVS